MLLFQQIAAKRDAMLPEMRVALAAGLDEPAAAGAEYSVEEKRSSAAQSKESCLRDRMEGEIMKTIGATGGRGLLASLPPMSGNDVTKYLTGHYSAPKGQR
ncbi:hypothetical protein CSOJ01_03983 [Colletotrichum sojae]|uniref:Uncharacterized protein n=1 Tax=Colletotrichum sojae TaxID=2175907 RepID=A0A8H6JKW9_9PEZI|nr:hypothetical protein CSOJ01_03983 [Colletotrichum sojae]